MEGCRPGRRREQLQRHAWHGSQHFTLVPPPPAGGYENEEHAAEAFDIAALKCKGRRVKTNFELTKVGVFFWLHSDQLLGKAADAGG